MCLVIRVACGGLIRIGTQVREGNLACVGRVLVTCQEIPVLKVRYKKLYTA